MGRIVQPPPGLVERLAAQRLGLGDRRGDPRHYGGYNPAFGFWKVGAAARSTVTPGTLTSGADTTDATLFDTASVSPTANRPVWAACAVSGPAATACVVTGNGLTWVQVADLEYTSSSHRRVVVFEAVGASPSAGAVRFAFGATTMTSISWWVGEATGGDSADQTVQFDTGLVVAGTTVNATLAALEHANNVHLAFVGVSLNAGVTSDADFAELTDAGVASAAIRLEVEWATNQTTCDPTFGSADAGIVGLEAKAA